MQKRMRAGEENFFCYRVFHFKLVFFKAICDGPQGRSSDSYGRRRRDLDQLLLRYRRQTDANSRRQDEDDINIRGMFRVFENRDEISNDEDGDRFSSSQRTSKKEREEAKESIARKPSEVCLAKGEYYAILCALFALLVIAVAVGVLAAVCYRRAR